MKKTQNKLELTWIGKEDEPLAIELLTWSVQSFGRAWLRLWRGLLLSFRQLRLVLEKD